MIRESSFTLLRKAKAREKQCIIFVQSAIRKANPRSFSAPAKPWRARRLISVPNAAPNFMCGVAMPPTAWRATGHLAMSDDSPSSRITPARPARYDDIDNLDHDPELA